MSLISFLPIIGNIIDRIIPDKNAAQKAKSEAERLALEGQLQAEAKQLDAIIAMGAQQSAVNVEEAKNSSVFVSGWRPAVGWICAAALGYQFIGVSLIEWACAINEVAPPARLDMGDLMTVLLGMLGLGGLRTYEKFKGVARK